MSESTPTTHRSGGNELLAGGALSVISAVVAGIVAAGSSLPDTLVRAPWSEGAFVPFILVATALHGVVLAGLLRLAGSGWLPARAGVRRGLAVAATGTVLLALAELLSLTMPNGSFDEGSGAALGGLYGLASLLAVGGMLAAGISTRRAGGSAAPLACAVLSAPVLVLAPLGLSWLGVLFYGAGFVVLGWAMVTGTRGVDASVPPLRAHAAE